MVSFVATQLFHDAMARSIGRGELAGVPLNTKALRLTLVLFGLRRRKTRCADET